MRFGTGIGGHPGFSIGHSPSRDRVVLAMLKAATADKNKDFPADFLRGNFDAGASPG
jgi:hypothetical protein